MVEEHNDAGGRGHPPQKSVYVRRRVLAAVVAVLVVAAVATGVTALVRSSPSGTDTAATPTSTGSTSSSSGTSSGAGSSSGSSGSSTGSASATEREADATQVADRYARMTPEVPAPSPSPSPEDTEQSAPSGRTTMTRIQRITDPHMSPKSIVASDSGILFAQNMMYRHTISVFRADGAILKTIPDSVRLGDFGIKGHPGTSRGAPVEMAFTPDGSHAWVSNYSMYGANFGPEGLDACVAGDGTDTSYVYRVDTSTLKIDDVVHVGAVPKYVAVTPDGSKVLVTNWCTWDLSIIDTAKGTEVARVPLGGTYPRGIVVSPDSSTAYVALMGSDRIVTVDLSSHEVRDFASPGDSPRHLVLSPDGSKIYVTNNRSGDVVKLDRRTGRRIGSVSTGVEPRSMTISSDGHAVYVVNYGSNTVSKVRTRDMKVLQTLPTDPMPIGITYEPTKHRVWVACYGGSALVYDDTSVT